MKTCIACGMPLGSPDVLGGEFDQGPACVHCVGQDGAIRPAEDIFEGGVQFFISAVPGADRDLAERLVRKNMNGLPYWHDHHHECLDGQQATDQEFAEAMAKL